MQQDKVDMIKDALMDLTNAVTELEMQTKEWLLGHENRLKELEKTIHAIGLTLESLCVK